MERARARVCVDELARGFVSGVGCILRRVTVYGELFGVRE